MDFLDSSGLPLVLGAVFMLVMLIIAVTSVFGTWWMKRNKKDPDDKTE